MINYILGIGLVFFLGYKTGNKKKQVDGKRYMQKLNQETFRKAYHNSVLGIKVWNLKGK